MTELRERRYLRGREVAERLGIALTTIYRFTRHGEFPQPLKFGRSTRWDVQAIDDWASRQCASLERSEFYV